MADGKAGAPKGNTNATKSRPWTDALARAMASDNGARLRKGAEILLDKIAEGDTQAMQIYADRMEGKAAQSVTVAGDADNPLTSVLDASKLTSEQLAIIAAIKISKSE
jgi:hypothetical protein